MKNEADGVQIRRAERKRAYGKRGKREKFSFADGAHLYRLFVDAFARAVGVLEWGIVKAILAL